jgi:hypothetical protein
MTLNRYFVVKRGGGWKINLEGRYIGEYPTQGVALCAARRLAKADSEQGLAAKVLAQGLNQKMRKEGVYHAFDRRPSLSAAAAAV